MNGKVLGSNGKVTEGTGIFRYIGQKNLTHFLLTLRYKLTKAVYDESYI